MKFNQLSQWMIIFMILLLISLVVFMMYTYNEIKYQKSKMQYLIRKDKKSFISELTVFLLRYPLIKKLLRSIALRIGMLSRYSYEKNLEYAVVTCLWIIGVITTGMFVIMPKEGMKFWYIGLFFIVICLGIISMLIYVFFAIVKMIFIEKLPNTFKVLNSRYISKGNILKAIYVSFDDFDKVIRKEMIKIYNVLKKNDMQEIEEVFSNMEETYRSEYVVILLSLIKQAHFKGGDDMIKEQFENSTEEILLEIENQKDLTAASRSYILLAIFLPFGMMLIKQFNHDNIGPDADKFYQSLAGNALLYSSLIALLLYIALLLFLERTA